MFKKMLAEGCRAAARSAGEILTGELIQGTEELTREALSWVKSKTPWAPRRAMFPFVAAAAGIGLSLGATAMYLLDPARGGERRSQLRERLTADLRGFLKQVNGLVRPGAVQDEQLAQNVRVVLEQVSSNPSAITVEARRGHVVLHGDLPDGELERVLSCVASVRGVRAVCNDLHRYAQSTQAPPEPVVH